jgi:DNA-binding protein H-NS
LFITYSQVSAYIKALRLVTAKELLENNEVVIQTLNEKIAQRETRYNQEIQTYKKRLEVIQSENLKINNKLVNIEQSFGLLVRKEKEIEIKEYTKTELDHRFTFILGRDKR